MLNQVNLTGRTTKDLELRQATNGRNFAIVTLAVARPFKNTQTDSYDSDFIDVTLWGPIAENVVKHIGKGSIISITGRLTTRIVDFPNTPTIRTLGVMGQQVSFIATKAPITKPSTKPITKKELIEKVLIDEKQIVEEAKVNDEILNDSKKNIFPTASEFEDALNKVDSEIPTTPEA